MRIVCVFTFALATMLVVGCSFDERLPVIADPTVEAARTPEPTLDHVDLTRMPKVSKGRIQDNNTQDGSLNPIARDLVANGKSSIPFLIGKLDDETKLKHPTINFWGEMSVGDVALTALFDLFSDRSEKPTISGFSWDEFLERGEDRTVTGEGLLRRYIAAHGRAKIKQRWNEMWEKNKDRIVWNEKCYCFGLAK